MGNKKKDKGVKNYYVCARCGAVYEGNFSIIGNDPQDSGCGHAKDRKALPIHIWKFVKKFRKIGMVPVKIAEFHSSMEFLYGNKVSDDLKFPRAVIIVFAAEGKWCLDFLNDILKDFDHFTIYEYRDPDMDKFHIALRFIEPGHMAYVPIKDSSWIQWTCADYLEDIFTYTEEMNRLIKLFKGECIKKKYKKFRKDAKKSIKKEKKEGERCKNLISNSEDITTPTENSQQPSSEE